MRYTLLLIFWFALSATSAQDTLPSIQEKTQNMQAYEGYFPFYWDAQEGRCVTNGASQPTQ